MSHARKGHSEAKSPLKEGRKMPFHLCRAPEGLPLGVIELLHNINHNPGQEDVLALLMDGLQGGLSKHGCFYLALPESSQAPQSTLLELFFEQVRQRYYPMRPSRLQSFFAVPEEASLGLLGLNSPHPLARVYEVNEALPGTSFTANMSLLHVRQPGAYTLANAHAYWRGERGDYPAVWEILIPRAVHVIRELPPIIAHAPMPVTPPPSPSSAHPSE